MSATGARSGGRSWLNGVFQALPIVFSYVFVGFAFGVLAQKAGISVLNTILISLIVYAGASQLIVVGLCVTGLSPLSIIFTTLVVNLRHLIMASAIGPFLKRWSKPQLSVFFFELTDENFAIHSARFATGTPTKGEIFGVNVTAQVSWLSELGLGSLRED